VNPSSDHLNDALNLQESNPATLDTGQPRSSFLRVMRLARKELRESLRDRRTLVTLIVMPLIVYPLLGSVVQKFAINRINPNSPPAIVVFDGSIAEELATAILAEAGPDSDPSGDGRKPRQGGSYISTRSDSC